MIGDFDRMSFREQYDYVYDAINKLNKMILEMGERKQAAVWRVPADDGRIVDCGPGNWVTATLDEPTHKDEPVPMVDWMCFWNPGAGSMVVEILRSHLVGLDTLVEGGSEWADQIRVSGPVLLLAERIHLYVISEEQISPEGEWMAPRRRLTTREWKEDL